MSEAEHAYTPPHVPAAKAIPDAVARYLDGTELPTKTQALRLSTVDQAGWPHAALLSAGDMLVLPSGRIRFAVLVEAGDPSVDSITSVWPAANFYEREVFDLFGVRFGGHPNLRRIMMSEDYQGNPLRKDFPVEGYR